MIPENLFRITRDVQFCRTVGISRLRSVAEQVGWTPMLGGYEWSTRMDLAFQTL